MEELRKTAFAYYRETPEDMKLALEHLFQEMDPDAKDRVSRQNFFEYMKTNEDYCAHMSNQIFFDVLKEESEELDFMDVMTLVYILFSGRPFCNGDCKNFIKGSYFTCFECYNNSTHTFNVCASCYLDGKYDHRHKKFLDNYLLPEAKRREALSLKIHHEASSIINNESKVPEFSGSKSMKKKLESGSGSSTVTTREAKASSSSSPPKPPPKPSMSTSSKPEASNSSTSNALVAVKPKPKHGSSVGKKAIKAAELALALGNIFVTSTVSQCVIL